MLATQLIKSTFLKKGNRQLSASIILAHFGIGISSSAGIGLIVPAIYMLLDEKQNAVSLSERFGKLGSLVQSVSPQKPAVWLFSIAVALVFIKAVLVFVRLRLSATLIDRNITQLRKKILGFILKQNMYFFQSKGSGLIYTQLVNNVDQASRYQHDQLEFAGISVQLFAYVMAMCWISWHMFAMCFVMSTPLYLVAKYINQTTKALSRTQMKNQALLARDIQDLTTGIRLVKFARRENDHIKTIESKQRTIMDIFHRQVLFVHGLGAVLEVFSVVLLLALVSMFILFQTRHYFSEAISVTTFFAFLIVLGRTIPIANSLSQKKVEMGFSRGATRELEALMAEDNAVVEVMHPKHIGNFTDSLKLSNVTFAYPNSLRQALRDISLSIKVGENIAVVGPSGSGKSTLIELLLRYYHPAKGSILLDGTDYTEIDTNDFKNLIGYVPQDPILFFTSIRENVRYFAPTATDSEIADALDIANLKDFVENLPEGLDTFVGERGTMMSGGQRQRLCIARALLSNPKILIFDEATSSLDAESEAKIVEAIKRASEGRTTVTVAHRLTTIQHCDRILVFEDGRIVEQGAWNDLCSTASSKLAELAAHQNLKVI